ncbi:MAG: PAS domain S-box protein, partial [bacterium]|nr:PAS domain S-box protein [Candidatus Kapabacteria bacterium]
MTSTGNSFDQPDARGAGSDNAARHTDHLSQYIESSPLGGVEWDSELRLIRWSPRSTEIFGWSEAEMIGLHPEESPFFHEESLSEHRLHMGHLIAGGELHSTFCSRNRTRDGVIIHCEWYNSAIVDAEGRVVSVLSLVHDVTERYRSEQQSRLEHDELERRVAERTEAIERVNAQLRDEIAERSRTEEQLLVSNRRFHTIFDQSFQFIGLLAPDGTLLEVNRTALQFAGLTLDEVIGRPFWTIEWWSTSSLGPDELRAGVLRAAAGKFVRFEVEVVGSEGRRAVIDFSLKPLKDVSGRVIQVIPEGRDITQRKRIEKALRESEDRFRKAFDNAPIGMAVVSLDGLFLKVNQTLCEIVGHSDRDLLSMSLQDATHADDLVRSQDELVRLLSGETRTYQIEMRFVRTDGEPVWVLLSVSLVRDEEWLPLYLIAQIQNIEDRRQSEEMMRRAMEAAEQA